MTRIKPVRRIKYVLTISGDRYHPIWTIRPLENSSILASSDLKTKFKSDGLVVINNDNYGVGRYEILASNQPGFDVGFYICFNLVQVAFFDGFLRAKLRDLLSRGECDLIINVS